MLGIQEYLDSYPGDRDAQQIRSALAGRLLAMYESVRRTDWKWFENILAYGNARLPQALLLVGSACADDRMVSAGLEALDWLTETQRCEIRGHFVPIGSQGFYRQGGEKARFDQQPLEAAGTVSACLKPTVELVIVGGAMRPGRLLTGSWATTIFSFLFMIASPVAAAMGFIPNVPMKIRARNRHCRS